MLTRTQTKHQVINHIIGCDHTSTDGDVEMAVDLIMVKRKNGGRITTKYICQVIDDVKEIQ